MAASRQAIAEQIAEARVVPSVSKASQPRRIARSKAVVARGEFKVVEELAHVPVCKHLTGIIVCTSPIGQGSRRLSGRVSSASVCKGRRIKDVGRRGSLLSRTIGPRRGGRGSLLILTHRRSLARPTLAFSAWSGYTTAGRRLSLGDWGTCSRTIVAWHGSRSHDWRLVRVCRLAVLSRPTLLLFLFCPRLWSVGNRVTGG